MYSPLSEVKEGISAVSGGVTSNSAKLTGIKSRIGNLNSTIHEAITVLNEVKGNTEVIRPEMPAIYAAIALSLLAFVASTTSLIILLRHLTYSYFFIRPDN